MTNKELFDTLLITGSIKEKAKNFEKEINYIRNSNFNIVEIYKVLNTCKYMAFSYKVSLLSRWCRRFEAIDDFDIRIAYKLVDTINFYRENLVPFYEENLRAYFLREDFIENNIDCVIRYVSILDNVCILRIKGKECYIRENKISYNNEIRTVDIYIEGEGIIEEKIYYIIFKGNDIKFIKELRYINSDEYDFIIPSSEYIRRYIK